MKTSDAGLYTCQATSETGETVWSAALAVEGNNIMLMVPITCIIMHWGEYGAVVDIIILHIMQNTVTSEGLEAILYVNK